MRGIRNIYKEAKSKVNKTEIVHKDTETVELPAVTASDAGKVLTVSADGKWVAASLPE